MLPYTDFDLTKFRYEPQNFQELYMSELGKAVVEFMTHPVNVLRMQVATDLERVAVEPLGKWLALEFGEEAADDRFKQFVGHIARQVMEHIGYQHDRKSLQITRPNLFASGSGYRKQAKPAGGMRITSEQRKAWLQKTANGPFNVWLDKQVKVDGNLDLERLYAVAAQYGITKRYDHLNPGQQRMNIGVALRKIVPKEVYEIEVKIDLSI